MSFELSREHEEFRESVRDFAEKEIAPHVADWDREHHFPVEVVHKMGALGLMGLTAPEEFGGAGEDGDFTSLCVAIEEIGRVDQSLGVTLEAAVGLGINPILTYGTDTQKQTWLPDLVAGRTLAGFGLTEAGAGSDASATRTRADLVNGEWVINGSKQFISNSGSSITSLVTISARTGERADGKPEISALIVPADTPGFTAEKAYDKLGWHISDTHPLTSRTPGCPRPTCSATGAAAMPSSCRPSTTAGSRSPRSPSVSSRPASSCASSTPASARRSAARSVASRASPSRSPTSR